MILNKSFLNTIVKGKLGRILIVVAIFIALGSSSNNSLAQSSWVARDSSRTWQSISTSADGTKLVALVNNGLIYTSTDSGESWVPRETTRVWVRVASSSDGTKLIAAVNQGQLFTSTDSGVTWIPRASTRNWTGVASSDDGTKLVAVEFGGHIYTSPDSGVSWVQRENSRNWRAVASSANGTNLVAVVDGGGQIYTSSDSGTTWTARESNRLWNAVASSSDGTKLIATASGGKLYTSTDSGMTWTPRESNRFWNSVASSADGSRLLAGVDTGQLYVSTDSGENWVAQESARNWRAVASSADGTRLVAVASGSQVYSLNPNLSITTQPIGGSGANLALQPVVLILDWKDNSVTSSTAAVTATLQLGTGGVLGGTTTVNAVNGVATFTNLTLSGTVGQNYVLRFTSPGLPFADSSGTTLTLPIASGIPTIKEFNGQGISPGSSVLVEQTLTNTNSSPVLTTYAGTVPGQFSISSCIGEIGSCVISNSSTIQGFTFHNTHKNERLFKIKQSGQLFSWTGVIPAKSSVKIAIMLQIGPLAAGGTQYCLATAVNGDSGSPICVVTSVPVGPGDQSVTLGQASTQKMGSVLLYSVYTSGLDPNINDSRAIITNISPTEDVFVRFFFVDGSNCSVADMSIRLSRNQTTSFLTSDADPGVTGYLIAVAVSEEGCPIQYNYLVGEIYAKFDTGHQTNLAAFGVAALGPPTCVAGASSATLKFDGISYNSLPRTLAIDSLESRVAGNASMIVLNRIGGDFSSGALTLGSLVGLLFDDRETSQSFTLPSGLCQVRGTLGNNYPRTAPRYDAVIPAGRTGWMKLWSTSDMAITGAIINSSTNGFSGGRNLHVLTTTNTTTLAIPVYQMS
jgi:hypothetical protein